jgi:hypothetical protein
MFAGGNETEEILIGNRIFVVNNIENPADNGKSGQIIQLIGDKAQIEYDDGETAYIPVVCVENLPRRFSGVMMKYSTKGILKNWKLRYFEVWSNSITYRIENDRNYKGVVMIKPNSEILYNPKDYLRKEPPLPYCLGLASEGRILWICSENEQQINDLKLALQDAINDSVMFTTT